MSWGTSLTSVLGGGARVSAAVYLYLAPRIPRMPTPPAVICLPVQDAIVNSKGTLMCIDKSDEVPGQVLMRVW